MGTYYDVVFQLIPAFNNYQHLRKVMEANELKGKQEINCSEMLCYFLDQKNDGGAALLSLVERYINHFSHRYGNLAFHDRQDIRQDVAIKLLSQGHKVRDSCSKAWVYVVVRNQCINHLRKQSKHMVASNALHYSELESDETGLVPSLDEGRNIRLIQQIDCLQKIFDKIEAQETGKSDIRLYTQYAFGLSYKEISNQTKRTVDAVGQRISILKKRLKKFIDECC
jgi:RNA polymerase sigma factor (sigma-70 family)